jgi:Xaa-Pro aminopeptidase
MLSTALRVFQLRLPTRVARPLRSCRLSSTMGAIGTQTVNTTDRLAALRNLMGEHNIDTYIVPSEDQRKCSGFSGPSDRGSTFTFADSSEYPAECDKRRAYISGFNGSAGSSFVRVHVSLLILIPLRHRNCNQGPSVSFHGWTLLSSGGETAR